jgi:N-acetylneuraminic acid mutarotase
VPGARDGASSSTDASGNFWLFGGLGDVLSGGLLAVSGLNDLWKYDPTSQDWTWVSGPNGLCAGESCGVYGTLGLTSAANSPHPRANACLWIDASGNLWLFGGTFVNGDYNDLWEYAPDTGEWTWVGGSNVANVGGVYGTKGVASLSNMPGARWGASSWIDASGNLWLFGGNVNAGNPPGGSLNDLWKYNPGTREWTWVNGSNVANAAGVYGSKGVASASNVPSARGGATSWIDASGNLWLFGGEGPPQTSGDGEVVVTPYFNDLWKYNPGTEEWTWISGASSTAAAAVAGVYGTKGVASASNVPSARWGASSWSDASGNLWLFGGLGDAGSYNDLWKFTPAQ